MKITMENESGEHPGLTDDRADRSGGFREPAALVTERRLAALEAQANRASAFDAALRATLEKRDPALGTMLRRALTEINMARTTASLDAQNGRL